MTEEQLEILMVKVVDGVATPAERETLMTHVSDKPELQQELEMHRSLKAITDGWVERLELDLAQDQLACRGVTRLWVTLGITLFVLGTALLLGGGMVELLLDPEAPLWLKLGFGGMASGSLVLLAGAVHWRWNTAQHDKYTEVVR